MTEPAVILAVHTTDPAGSVALVSGGSVRCAEFEAGGKDAPVLLELLVPLLDEAGTRLSAQGAIAVTTGPGSFTGIRVGLATVQGLALARGLRVLVSDSLRARAAAWGGAVDVPLAIVLDARRGEVYAALYDARETVPRALVEPFCAPPEEAAARLADGLGRASPPPREQGIALSGSGASLVAPRLHEVSARVLDRPPMPVARALGGLAQAGACRSVPPWALEPTYLRKSDAEVRRDSPPGSGT